VPLEAHTDVEAEAEAEVQEVRPWLCAAAVAAVAARLAAVRVVGVPIRTC
jgi:hypothetical protein